MVSLEPTTAWFWQCATACDCFAIRSTSYPTISDRGTRTHIFRR
uniref:Uncharacterized protein n=1 Tax=Salmonella phage PMBT31 TaxID=3153514 RepID=A0AAU8GJY7_9CAUD